MIYENPLEGQFVRFVRGTEANWALLSRKDPNTLYFILAANGQSGKLYLGSILIGGVNASGGGSSVVSLTDLSDVLVNAVENRDVLLYNSTSGAWENTSIDALLASALANANHLHYTIVESLDDIDLEDPNADGYIYLVPTEQGNDTYDEYMVIDGELVRIGSWDTDLSNYVTTTEFETRVGTLEDLLNDTTDENTGDTIPGLVTRVSTLEELLYDTEDQFSGTTIPGLITTVGNFPNEYVSKSQYNSEVGDASQLINSTGSSTAPTIVQQVNNLTERLTWYEIQQLS